MCLALSCCPQGNPRGAFFGLLPPLNPNRGDTPPKCILFYALPAACPTACMSLLAPFPHVSSFRSASGLCFCPRRWCLFKMITLRTRWRSREKTNVCYWGVKIFHYKYTWSENPTLSSLCVIFRIKVWALVYLWLWLWLCQLLLLLLLFSRLSMKICNNKGLTRKIFVIIR